MRNLCLTKIVLVKVKNIQGATIKDDLISILNPLNAKPTKWQTHLNNSSAFVNELSEFAWPYCGIGA